MYGLFSWFLRYEFAVTLLFNVEMKKLSVVQAGSISAQWQVWIDGLSEAGFDIRMLDHATLDPHDLSELFGDAILLDGMLPRLPQLIASIGARHPDMQIVVATEVASFTIYYEVQHLNGTVYVYDPLSAKEFATPLQNGPVEPTSPRPAASYIL